MKKLAVVATAFVALGALSSARAADLPPPVIAKAPVVVPWSWTGPYIGANGGYSWGNWGSTNVGGTPTFPGTTTALGTTANPNVQGGFGGIQAGFNWQFAPHWLVGVEADVDWSGERASDPGSFSTSFPSGIGTGICDAHPICTTTVTGTTTNNWNLQWFSTLRARGGWIAGDSWLLYGTGGVAFAGTRFANTATTTATITNSIGQTFPGFPVTATSALSEVNDRVGFAVGAGVEKRFAQNWTVRAEYLFMDFG
jgi:outer membrane immunogenic protein